VAGAWLLPPTSSNYTSTALLGLLGLLRRTAQLTTLVRRLSGIRTQSGQTKINVDLTA
jgi:hypothetical protein